LPFGDSGLALRRAWANAGAKCGSLAARSWLAWGRAVDLRKTIPRGAVLIFRRGRSSWQGHVCLCLEDRDGTVTVIGGNQSDAVTIVRYRKSVDRSWLLNSAAMRTGLCCTFTLHWTRRYSDSFCPELDQIPYG
jgi:hypothetical protein